MTSKSGDMHLNRGFKRPTIENWLEADPIVQALVNVDHRDGSISSVRGSDWIQFVNSVSIAESAPLEVHDAFQFATGAIGYAYFYYPIFTIVSQQVLRVADYAVDKLFDRRGLNRVHSFARRLQILRQAGLLSDTEANRWDGIRRLRNAATHPAWQQNWGSSLSLDLIRIVAEAISALPWPVTVTNEAVEHD